MAHGVVVRALIYVCGRAGRRREADCLAHCEARGYRLVGLLRDDTAGLRFGELAAMALCGQIEVVVTPAMELLPAGRTPRIEPVDVGPPLVRRNAAGALYRRRPRPVG